MVGTARGSARVCASARISHSLDIKPANLMLATDGALKVMDFGIARVVSGRTRPNTAMMVDRSRRARILLRGQTATPSADIDSFGVLVYELLTGELPVGRFASPSTVVAGLSKGVDDRLEQMLQMNPKQRGESLQEAVAFASGAAWKSGNGGRASKARAVVALLIEVFTPSPQPTVLEPMAGERQVFCAGGAEFPMRWIPVGRFWMGLGIGRQGGFWQRKATTRSDDLTRFLDDGNTRHSKPIRNGRGQKSFAFSQSRMVYKERPQCSGGRR